MKIFSIDVGKNFGVVIYDTEKEEVSYHVTLAADDVRDFADLVNPLLHKEDVDVVVSAYPTRMYNVIFKHSKLLGVLEYLASKMKKQVVYANDSSAKKKVFGKGKMDKAEIEIALKNKGYSLASEHENDALMFAKWYQLSI